ncbi:glycosyltransferase family 4 protein [Bacillus sp. FJAT-47783]|uniref:glycosyltransferase family 4 protein n=1 Tax=Bacillus sp. FJAT-47783 TaxID=2922712 RepID=UPI001FAC892B|nr:glycosyltransferase family 4 protein [Bacillus sp. FJAT-47783]
MRTSIVHIHQKFYPYEGGSTQRLLNQLSYLDKSKYDVYVLCEKIGEEPTEENYQGINIIRYNRFYEIPFILKRLTKQIEINILHAHNFRPSFYANLFNLFSRKVFIIEMHSIYTVKNKISAWIGNKLLSKANSIIVLSNKSREILLNNLNISGEVNVIYNGIDLNDFRFANKEIMSIDRDFAEFVEEAAKKKDILVGYIGSIRPFQGIDNLIKIINSVTNEKIKFIVVGGNNQESNNIKSKIKNRNVFVREFVKKDKVKHIYKNIDILLMPRPKIASTDSALPLKPIESIAAGNLIYATNVGGMVELKQLTNSPRIKFLSVEEMIEDLNRLHIGDIDKNTINEGELGLFDIKSQVKILDDIYSSLLMER